MAFNFSGMGAVYPGYLDAMKAEGAGRISQAGAEAAELDMPARDALGRAIGLFQGGVPGATPMPGTAMGGPQPPPPGQASAPAAPPGGPGGGGGMPGQADVAQPPLPAAMPAPGPAQQVGGGGAPQTIQGRGNLDLPTAIALLQQANPGIRPAVLQRALELAQPALNAEARQQLAMMQMDLRAERVGQQERDLERRTREGQQRDDRGNRRLELAERVADINEDIRRLAEERRTAQGNRRIELDEEIRRKNVELREAEGLRRQEQGDRRLDQGDTRLGQGQQRIDRLLENDIFRRDATATRLRLQREDMERKLRQGDTRIDLAQWRAVVDAEHKRTMEIISTHTAGGIGVPASEKAALIAAADKMRDDALARMKALRQGRPGGVPGAGSGPIVPEAPPAVAPPAPAAVAPAAPVAAPTPPPEIIQQLKEGVPTLLNTPSGQQKWMLQNGTPVQVP